MKYVDEVLRKENDGSVSFGNYTLASKTKVENFKSGNDILKVKTFAEMTRLEKNDLFAYESEPGTAVFNYVDNNDGVSFCVCGKEDAQITVGLAEDTEYTVCIDDVDTGKMKTNLSGKLSISVGLADKEMVKVSIQK